MKLLTLMTLVVSCVLGAGQFSAAAQGATTHTVVIEGMKFVPESLAVKVGDSVVWVNKDFFPHTATADKRAFDSGEIQPNSSRTLVMKKKGDFPYICTLHPTMKGSLTVK